MSSCNHSCGVPRVDAKEPRRRGARRGLQAMAANVAEQQQAAAAGPAGMCRSIPLTLLLT